MSGEVTPHVSQPVDPSANLGLGDVLSLSVRLAQFDSSAIEEARSPRVELWAGMAVVALAGAASGLFGGLWGIVASAMLSVVSHLVVVVILHALATMLGGRGDYLELVKVLGVGSLVKSAHIIPIVGVLGTLWFAALSVPVLSKLYGISTERAVLAVILPAVLMALVHLMLFAAVVSLFALWAL